MWRYCCQHSGLTTCTRFIKNVTNNYSKFQTSIFTPKFSKELPIRRLEETRRWGLLLRRNPNISTGGRVSPCKLQQVVVQQQHSSSIVVSPPQVPFVRAHPDVESQSELHRILPTSFLYYTTVSIRSQFSSNLKSYSQYNLSCQNQ